nr:putative late blight resistance protein homolog R1B-23 [Ipomoea trifida]
MNPNNHIGRLENLKKLVVCDFPFGWKVVNSLSKLPKLEVLKLLRCFCIGEEEWKLSKKDKFEQLIYLKIDAIDLKCWEASAYHFPKSIKLIRCLPSAVASANQIWEEQLEQGNDDMIVIEEDTIQSYYSKVSNKDEANEDEADEDESEDEFEEDESEDEFEEDELNSLIGKTETGGRGRTV